MQHTHKINLTAKGSSQTIRSFVLALLLICSFALTPLCMHAQGTTATLGGIVSDATGAVVPNAVIKLTNTATGDVRTLNSNGSGVFAFTSLPSGDYDILITSAGFTSFTTKGIHLDPGDSRSVNGIKLAAGDATTVEVTTAEDRVNVDSGEQSSLISAAEIQHLSVQGRDVTELLKILPGFAISNGGTGNVTNVQYDPSQVNFSGALGQYAANGTPVNGQALLSDGVDITDPGNFGQSIQNVNYEQVAEVKVQTSSFTADTAHGPVVINAIGKSGGNQFHGSLYGFARTYQLNSNDWLSNATNQPKPQDRFVYPGGTFGGPVLIPGTNFNHDRKLTFFVGAEDYAQRNVYAYGSSSNAVLTALVPTAAMRTGDFSKAQIQQYLGSSYVIDTDATAINGGGVPGGPCYTLNPNGSINSTPPDQNICRVPQTGPDGSALINGNISKFLDPLTKLILNGFPLPNTTSNGTYNWITTNLENNDLYQARGRFDYAATSNDHIFGSYSVEKGVGGVPQNEYYSARGNLGGVNVPGGGLISTVSSHVASLNYSHTFGSTLTNEFYAAGAYFSQAFNPKSLAATAGNPYLGIFNNGSHVQPTLEDYGNDGLPLLRTPDGSFGGIFAKKQVRIAGDNLTKLIGKHTIRAGVFYQWDANPQVAPFINTNGTVNLYYIGENVNNGFVNGVQQSVHSTGIVGSGNGGNFLADFAEGQIFQYNQTNFAPEPNLYFWNLAGFVQDHWRLTSRISIDAGVRLEHFTPWQDSHSLGIGVFSPADYAAGVNANVAPGIQWHGINSAIPSGGRPTRAAFVSPRGGLSWDIYGTGNTVLRLGAGVYRAHDSYNDAQNEAQTTEGLRTVTVNGPVTLASVNQYASSVIGAGGFVNDSTVYAFDPHDDEEPRVVTYNLAIDQRLPGSMLLEIAYVGNRSDKLLNDGSTQNTTLDNLNTLPVGALFGPQPASRPDTMSTAGMIFPLFGPASANGATNSAIGNLSQAVIDSYKKYPLYNHLFVPEHNTYSNYNGLQVGLTRQKGHSTFSTNYTFSKALGILGIGGSATYSYPGDPNNYANDYNSLPFDRRHIFNAAYSYVFGDLVKGNRFVGVFTNGWELSGITNYQSGPNLQATVSSDFGANGNLTVPVGTVAAVGKNVSVCNTINQAPTDTCSVPVSSTDILGTPDVNLQPTLIGNPAQKIGSHNYINGAAFALPLLGTNGPYRYPATYGPGFFDTDLTAAKQFKIREHNSIQLRVAAFNFINHGNNTFTPVSPTSYTASFNGAGAGDLNSVLASARINNAAPSSSAGSTQFGTAALRTGRRIMELGIRYDF